MKRWMINGLVILLALGLGVGGAFIVNAAKPASTTSALQQQYDRDLPRFQYRQGTPGGMMGPWFEWRRQNRTPGQAPQQDQDDSGLQ